MSDPIDIANEKNEELQKPSEGNFSHADNSKILTNEEQSKKEEKAKLIIDEIVENKLKPIEAQLQQLPQLIHDIVIQVMNELSVQQQAQPQPQAETPKPTLDINAISQLAPIIGQFLGKGETAANPNTAILDMIVQSYMKRMQMDIDAQFMNTYQQQVNPPNWQRENIKTPGKNLVE